MIQFIFMMIAVSCDAFVFMLLYSLGGYIKLFQDTKYNKKRIGGYMIAAGALLMFGSSVVFCLLGKVYPMFVGLETYFFHKNSIFTILIALGMLIFAVNQKPRYNKAVNLISSCTFGIYLLHDNSLIRRFIWSDLLRAPTLANSPFMIVHCFGSVLTIFLVGIIIELIRKNTIEKLFVFVYDKVIEKNKKITRKETRGSNDVTIQE